MRRVKSPDPLTESDYETANEDPANESTRKREKGQLFITFKYKPAPIISTLGEDELPYRGVLRFEDANTFHTRPTRATRHRFQKSLIDCKPLLWQNTEGALFHKPEGTVSGGQSYTKAKEVVPISKIRCIHFKGFEIDTWYTAPYPEEYSSKPVLHVCEYCLKYMSSKYIMQRHRLKCTSQMKPPGNEIYRHKNLAVFEIDGRKNTVYAQNLCIMAKLFLNSKTLYYDVQPFMFYVLTEVEMGDYHFVGYFSKEKLNTTNYNVSCILTLPIFQRKGYGNFLIQFSYLLSLREYKLGTPEKPLSDLGLYSYRNFWKVKMAQVLKKLCSESQSVSISQLSALSGMIHNDVVCGLEQLQCLVRNHTTGKYAISVNIAVIDGFLHKWSLKKYPQVNPDALVWKPMILGPSGGINTTSTMVVTMGQEQQSVPSSGGAYLDEKGNPPTMPNISFITNYLKDDITDSRPMEVAAMHEVRENECERGDSSDYVVCYPGIDLSPVKKVLPVIEEDEDDQEESPVVPRSPGIECIDPALFEESGRGESSWLSENDEMGIT